MLCLAQGLETVRRETVTATPRKTLPWTQSGFTTLFGAVDLVLGPGAVTRSLSDRWSGGADPASSVRAFSLVGRIVLRNCGRADRMVNCPTNFVHGPSRDLSSPFGSPGNIRLTVRSEWNWGGETLPESCLSWSNRMETG